MIVSLRSSSRIRNNNKVNPEHGGVEERLNKALDIVTGCHERKTFRKDRMHGRRKAPPRLDALRASALLTLLGS